ncbi:MAG: sulfotransferase [Planctomycetales bacterium]|nr:sulfotransferase [Planctomycetales bacterium]
MTAVDEKPRTEKKSRRSYNLLTPRFWHGMTVKPWFSLLARNKFDLSPTRLHLPLAISFFTALNSAGRVVQESLYRRKADRVELAEPPIFIIGHWRSGTTLLHELLVRDPRHTFPTTYQCFAPNHFLVTDWFVPRVFGFVLPTERPMDNMAAGWQRPQEDEFALCNLGVPSPYLEMAFPNRPPAFPEYLDLAGLTPEQLESWKTAFRGFLQRLSLRDPRRIVLKSPPHTARVRVLADMFPEARFVHIVRHPYSLFPSTMKLWRSLHDVQSLQTPREEHLEEYVFRSFERMYEAFERDRESLAPNQLFEVRYEDLVAEPIAHLRSIYEQLMLGDSEEALPHMREYLAKVAGYKTNRHQVSDALRAKIDERWGSYLRQYGYDTDDG